MNNTHKEGEKMKFEDETRMVILRTLNRLKDLEASLDKSIYYSNPSPFLIDAKEIINSSWLQLKNELYRIGRLHE